MHMLENLSQYENLGTPKYFCELLERLRGGDGVKWTIADIDKYFYNRLIDGQSVFDGCLPLAAMLGMIKIDADDVVAADIIFIEQKFDEAKVSSWMLDRLLKTLKGDEEFLAIMCSEHVSYDVIYRLIQVEDARYRRLFDLQLLPEIRRRKIGIDSLRESLERRQLDGLRAEEFVLAFEKRRLTDHPAVTRIERISDYDTEAGYDIVSFNQSTSASPDRFIEVKSYESMESFYWSANEIRVSRIRRAAYFLYLVDRKKMDIDDYVPTMIQDPFENVFKNEEQWSKEAKNWRFFR
jgi:hypothetical protein